MGRTSNAQRAHPGKTCTECSKCKKTRGKEARNFIHVIEWKDDDKKALFEDFGLDSTCCLCDACRQVIKRHFKGQETGKTKKRKRAACFLSDFNKCEEQSTIETVTEEWAKLAACFELQTCSPPASLPPAIHLCDTHYKQFKTSKVQKCANCRRLIKGRVRKCPNPELINQFSQEFGLDVVLHEESPICTDCYFQQRAIVQRDENLKSNSNSQELQDIVNEQEAAAQTTNGDPPSFAIAQAVLYVGHQLLESKPLLLQQAYSVYERSWKEAWRTAEKSPPSVPILSRQSLMIELLKVYGHHVTYSSLTRRQHGTLLLRKGSDLRAVIHTLMVQSVDATPAPVPPETCTKPQDVSDREMLGKAAQVLNSELRRQSREFSNKLPSEHDLKSFDPNRHIQEINPVVWNFFYLLTESTTEQRERDRCGDFDWNTHYGTTHSSIRRLYQICHALFLVNDKCSYPLHLLLADTIECQGGSQALLQILNRFGITSSRRVLDFHKNAVTLSNSHSMDSKLAKTSFSFTSIDNIDKGAPNAHVTADGKSRSVHGTSYQVVFPQPYTNKNSGDDFVSCSTSTERRSSGNSTKKIQRDFKNLYRCLAVRNCSSLRSCNRNEQGAPVSQSDQELEDFYVQYYKEEIISCMAENEEVFMDKVGSYLPITCLDMAARLELLKKESVTPGEIEAAAVAYLAKCPVHIYRPMQSGRYMYLSFGACYNGVEPLMLVMDATGFDLILSSDLQASTCDLIPLRANATSSLFREWRGRNMYLLKEDQLMDMTLTNSLQEGKTTDTPNDLTDPKPAKIAKLNISTGDINAEREHRRHQYERGRRLSRPSSQSLDDFKCSADEQREEKLSREKVLTYIWSKVDQAPGSDPLKLKGLFAAIEPPEKSDIVYLGVLNEHADSIDTVLNVLSILQAKLQVSTQLKHLIVVGDGKTYCHLQQIKREYSLEMEWMVPFPGDWHLLKNLQPVLMKIYWHAGLHDIAKKNHKGATLTSLAQCSNFKRTHNFLMNAWEALYRSQVSAFLNKHPEEKSEEKLKVFADHLVGQSDTYRLWHSFIHRDMMSYVLLFLAIRTGNWDLRVLALKKMAPLFHAYDRPMYLRILPLHLYDILEMPTSLLEHLKKGGFSVSLRGLEGQSVAADEAHEMGINRDVKMALHRPDPSLMDRLSLYLPYRAMVQRNLCEHVLPPSNRENTNAHQEANVALYMNVLSETVVTQTDPQTTHLHSLITMQPADEVQTQDMRDFYELGQKDLDLFIMSRILHEPTAQAPKRRRGLRTFLPKQPRKSMVAQKDKNKRIVAACLRRQLAHAKKTGNPIVNLGQYIQQPLAIAKSDGSMYKGSKAVATSIYKKRYDGVFESNLPKEWHPNCVVLEGMFMINAAPLQCHKTFRDYAWRIITSFLRYYLDKKVSEVHIVFDHPDRNGLSPKTLEKQRRDEQRQVDEGTYTAIAANTPLPSNWRKFLASRQQKRLLINFLSTEIPCLVKDLLQENQTLVIAGGLDNENSDMAISCTKSGIVHNPAFASNHEEGDSRVWFHACQTSCKKICIYSPDTDTYHVGLPLTAHQLREKEVVVQLSMKSTDQMYCNMNAFVEKLQNDPDLHHIPAEHRAAILQATYVCSGCDYTSFFAGCGKTAFFAALFQYAEFITSGTVVHGYLCSADERESLFAFYRLVGSVYFKRYFASFRPVKTPHELFKTVESEDEETKHKMWLDKIREGTWEKADFEDGVMPSNESLSLHWKRCTWVLKLWRQACESNAHHPPLHTHGYNVQASHLSVVWDSDENNRAIELQVDWILKGCKCTTGCATRRCKCRKESRPCGPGCSCTNCSNPQNQGAEVATASDVSSLQAEEVALLEEINPDEAVEVELSDSEADTILWDEDAQEEDDCQDDNYDHDVC